MTAPLFATVTVRAGDFDVHGTFDSHGDAMVAADWLTDEDTFGRPIALHPPEPTR